MTKLLFYIFCAPIFFYFSPAGVPTLSDIPGIDISPKNQYAIPIIILLYTLLATKKLKFSYIDLCLTIPCVFVLFTSVLLGLDNLRFYFVPIAAIAWLIFFDPMPKRPDSVRLNLSRVSLLLTSIYGLCALIAFPSLIPIAQFFSIFNLYQYGPSILSIFLLIHLGLNRPNNIRLFFGILGICLIFTLSYATDGDAFLIFSPFLLIPLLLNHFRLRYRTAISNISLAIMIFIVITFPFIGIKVYPTDFQTLNIRFAQFSMIFENWVYFFNPFWNVWRLGAHGSMHNELVESISIFGAFGPLILVRIYYKLSIFLNHLGCAYSPYVLIVFLFSGLTILPLFNFYLFSLFVLISRISYPRRRH